MRRLLALGIVAVILAGCRFGSRRPAGGPATASATAATVTTASPDRPVPIHVTASASLQLTPTPQPAGGPALSPQDLLFTDARHGFLVTAGQRYADASGDVRIDQPGLIQQTDDGGATWTTVWEDRDTGLYWIGKAGADLLAAGARYVAGAPPGGHPVLLVSQDGGHTWREITPHLPDTASADAWWRLRFDFPDAAHGYAVVDPDYSAAPDEVRGILRTADGGSHWTVSPLPANEAPTGGIAFLNAAAGFVTAAAPDCAGQVLRTSDAGKTWTPSGPCLGYPLYALDFLDGRTGFAGGGLADKFDNPPWQVLLATVDGGRTWTTRYADPRRPDSMGGPLASLRFADARHGWAVTGTCVQGQNYPCYGDLLMTSDGGATWEDTGRVAGHIAVVGASAVSAIDPSGVIWQTEDAGRDWQPRAAAAALHPQILGAEGHDILVRTSAGLLSSTDGGASWSPLRPPVLPALPRWPGPWAAIPPSLIAVGDGTQTIRTSQDGGETWHTVTLGGASPVTALAFADATHGWAASGLGGVCGMNHQGVPLWATTDGGRTWASAGDLPVSGSGLAAAPGLLVAAGDAACRAPAVAISRDGGDTCHLQSLPQDYLCTPGVAAPATIWLACLISDATGTTRSALLMSGDGGTSWRRLTASGFELSSPTPLPTTDGWLAGGDPMALWHTTDGGRTWQEVWPRLPTS